MADKPWDIQNYLEDGRGGSMGTYSYNTDKNRRNYGNLPEVPVFPQDPMSYTNEDLARQLDALKQNSFFRNQGGFSGMNPNFYDKSPPPPESKGLWSGLKKMVGKLGLTDYADALKTGYGIYNNETFTKPMLLAKQARAAELWNTQKPMMEYNLASARRNEGRADAYQVGLWNAQRPQGTEERTIEQGMPRATYNTTAA
jgi:hypothetical protein